VKLTNQRHVIALSRPRRIGADAQAERARLKAAAGEHIVYVKASLGVVVKIKRVLRLISMLTASLLMVKATNAVLAEKANEVAELVAAGWSVECEAGVEVTCPDRIGCLDKCLVVLERLEQRLDVRPRIRMRHRPHGKK